MFSRASPSSGGLEGLARETTLARTMEHTCMQAYKVRSIYTRVATRGFRGTPVTPHKESVQEETSESIMLEPQKQLKLDWRENDTNEGMGQETAEQCEARHFLQRQDRAKRIRLSSQETAEQREDWQMIAQAQLPCTLWTTTLLDLPLTA